MALSLLPVCRTLRPTPRPDTAGGLLHAFAAMPRLLRRSRLVALYAATVTLMTGFVALYTAVAVAGPPGVAGNPTTILVLRASALPALVAVPLLAPVLSRLAAPKRLVLALGVAAVAIVTASLLGGHTILLAVVLLLFVGAVAAAAPAVVETVNATAPHARGAAVALYACSMFIGASLGPQPAGTLTGQGFGTSTAGFQAVPHMAVYSATKAFVLSFTRSLWGETRGTGVTVLGICPGATDTPFFDVAGDNASVGSQRTPQQVVNTALAALGGRKATVVDGTGNALVSRVVSRLAPERPPHPHRRTERTTERVEGRPASRERTPPHRARPHPPSAAQVCPVPVR
ncbi:SDR family NAD(P)-dependent oxidoreductase [Streptomyces anulatus]